MYVYTVGSLSLVLIDKVRDCSFRLHTLLTPFPTHLGPLDLYLVIAPCQYTRFSLHCRNSWYHIHYQYHY